MLRRRRQPAPPRTLGAVFEADNPKRCHRPQHQAQWQQRPPADLDDDVFDFAFGAARQRLDYPQHDELKPSATGTQKASVSTAEPIVPKRNCSCGGSGTRQVQMSILSLFYDGLAVRGKCRL